MSDTASSSEAPDAQAQKRKATTAGLDGNGTGNTRSVKRRASKACQCCRARKVRCNVTEHGAPCTNCRLDEVECIVSESRRKKKWSKDDDSPIEISTSASNPTSRKLASRDALDGLQSFAPSALRRSHASNPSQDEHVPHSIYQSTNHRLSMSLPHLDRRMSMNATSPGAFPVGYSPLGNERRPSLLSPLSRQSPLPRLPYYIKPLPPRIGQDEISYLDKKGALTVPDAGLRNELLRAYIEFVHPYMPLLELHDFLLIIESGNGSLGRISLILFQAVMFAGSAFVDMQHLRNAGYLTRKEARKDFFQKTRLLYDFDYESDRVSLVQALLLLTYYYETPDDQKDTWHWMGVATSVAHTIGLHRNPEKSTMDSKRIKLWKRIWWSTFMRDRLIALGMRRPTRIKAEDYDVPMLTLDDFEISAIPESITCVPAECTVGRDVEKQRRLAVMCIEKAKLCLCISHVLSKQYCVLNNNQGLVNDKTTMMLLPKKLDPEACEVKACDDELQRWQDNLPPEAFYSSQSSGDDSLDLHKSLLHMVFFTTLSALHRPQVLPSAPTIAPLSSGGAELLDLSRRHVRRAAAAITNIAQFLDSRGLVRFLPTTGVTVLLPAIIIHLLDIKAPDEATRRSSLRGFCQCMQVMGKLRDLYAAADYSTAFLEAAIRKAGIQLTGASAPKPEPVTTVEDLVDAGRRLDSNGNYVQPNSNASMATMNALNGISAKDHALRTTLTPPPDLSSTGAIPVPADSKNGALPDEEVQRRLQNFLASTPPASDHSDHQGSDSGHDNDTAADQNTDDKELFAFSTFPSAAVPEFDQDDFDSLLNLDALAEGLAFDVDVGMGDLGDVGDVEGLQTQGQGKSDGPGMQVQEQEQDGKKLDDPGSWIPDSFLTAEA